MGNEYLTKLTIKIELASTGEVTFPHSKDKMANTLDITKKIWMVPLLGTATFIGVSMERLDRAIPQTA